MARGVWAAAVVVCTLGGGAARAEEETSPEAVAAATTLPSPSSEVREKPKKPATTPEEEFPGATRADRGEAVEEEAKPSEPKVTAFGRVIARGGADERQAFEREMGIQQARIGVKASFGMADAVVEGDLAGKTLLRDAYLRLRATEHLRVYGGQFKAPFMQRSLESTWDLPRIGRGLVEDYLIEEHQLGGRRLGLMAEGRFKSIKNLRISGGVFQGGEDLEGNRAGEDVAARVSVRPWKALTVATSAYLAEIGTGFRRFAAGGDATLELGRFSVTGEALVGRLMVGRFTSQTAILRYDLAVGSGWVVQPTVSAEGLQLRGEQTGVAWGGALGLNAILDDRFRIQVQTQRMQDVRDTKPNNDVTVQVGAKF